jgi:hypothetical protein
LSVNRDFFIAKSPLNLFSEILLLNATTFWGDYQLAQRNAANLTKALIEANEQKKLTRRTPAESEVVKWITHAKELPRMLEY